MATDRKTFLLTGATSGLGLATARLLAGDASRTLILPVRSAARGEALRAALGMSAARIETPLADLESLAEVAALADSLAGRMIDGLANIAGLQFQHGRARSRDGHETTFAVNHLAAFALTLRLLPQLAPAAPVVFVGSGTHNTRDIWARAFGFRGGRYTSVERLARGDCGETGSEAQHGRDLYATSKLCNVATTFALAQRVPAAQARFLAIDPGLMPGTGLARDGNALVRFVWTRVMRPLLPGLAGVSTAERSGAVLAQLLSGERFAELSGLHCDYRGEETPTSSASRDPALIEDLLRASLALCGLPGSLLP
jgi:NAD(P)-dependent dehydrogenase (short-subunit alcohol dehydrogenase family)